MRKMCQAELGALTDLTPLNGKEISIAGVVTSVTPLTTKDGRRYGRFVLEDYNSQHEFTLFSKDYEKFGLLIEQDNFLYIRGRVQPRPYKEPAELEFKITSIQQLADVADSISSIRIDLNIGDISNSLTNLLMEQASKNEGTAQLIFNIYDPTEDVRIKLNSRRYRVAPTVEFMDFLDENEIYYTINI
jgi:DNA polymerase-3 subunit alpha